MADKDKDKADLAAEVVELRRQAGDLERAEAKRKEAEKRLSVVNDALASSVSGVIITDLEGRITYVNRAFLLLFDYGDASEVLDKNAADLFPGERVMKFADVQSIIDSLRGDTEELTVRRRDGATFPVEASTSIVTDAEGNTVGRMASFVDITGRKRAEEALRRAVTDLARSNKELVQFAYVASHDLQEPLRKILAFGDRLKDACTGAGALSTSGRDCLERMLGASRRMEALIDGLLAYSRLGARTSPRAAVDLSEVVQAVLSDLEVQVRKVGGRVETGDLPTVEADPTQMRQLLQNLIGNALKFHRPDEPPVVKVHGEVLGAEGTPAASGAPMERHCRIIVEDNGIGFDEKYAERIFEVFQRLHGRAAYEGTGVGLAICRRIVERHHGSIVARGSPGQGATFVVTLPLRQCQEASVPWADTGTPSASSLPTTIPTTAS